MQPFLNDVTLLQSCCCLLIHVIILYYQSNLQRRGTPYPKDLRDRHPHLIRKRSESQDVSVKYL